MNISLPCLQLKSFLFPQIYFLLYFSYSSIVTSFDNSLKQLQPSYSSSILILRIPSFSLHLYLNWKLCRLMLKLCRNGKVLCAKGLCSAHASSQMFLSPVKVKSSGIPIPMIFESSGSKSNSWNSRANQFLNFDEKMNYFER